MIAYKMYEELTKWWPLISPPDEYTEEAAFFLEVLGTDESSPRRTLVEFGSGGGSNAFHFKQHFTLTLVDIAPDMLAISQTINPECEHLVGDMRTARLEREFDVVFIHDAVDYMTSEAELRQAFATAFVHCKPGGVALFVPDHVRETFEPSTDHDGRDGEGSEAGRSIRYLEWHFDPDPTDSTCVTHYVYMLREGDTVHVEHEQHIFGLFAKSEWVQWLSEVGFTVGSITDDYDRELFIAQKPSA